MAFVVDTVAALGTGTYDGQRKVIQYGPPGQQERAGMRWRADVGKWVSDERVAIAMRDSWIMDPGTIHQPGTTWGYLSIPLQDPSSILAPANRLGQASYSWSPRAIRHADAAFAAGLKLQENVIFVCWVWGASDVLKLATVFYPIGVGDRIDNIVLVPDAHIGTQVQALGGVRRFVSTGWHDSLKQASTKPNLAPHLYGDKEGVTTGPNSLEYFTAYWRWTGTPPPGGAARPRARREVKSEARARRESKPRSKPRPRAKR